MNLLMVAGLSALLYALTIPAFKLLCRFVPVILFALPVVLVGLGGTAMACLSMAVGLPGFVTGGLTVLAALASAFAGHKLANDFFVDLIMRGK